MSAHFSEEEMGKAMKPVFLDKMFSDSYYSGRYQDHIEEGSPDVAVVKGAPDEYEAEIRFKESWSDLYYNANYHDLSDTTYLIPREEYEISSNEVEELVDKYSLDLMISEENLGIDLSTTFHDIKSAEIASNPGERVHFYCSDYHWRPVHYTANLHLRDRDVQVFGMETEKDNLVNRFKQDMNVLKQFGHMAADYMD